eukprot:3290798-Prymnesium_polylepis.1
MDLSLPTSTQHRRLKPYPDTTMGNRLALATASNVVFGVATHVRCRSRRLSLFAPARRMVQSRLLSLAGGQVPLERLSHQGSSTRPRAQEKAPACAKDEPVAHARWRIREFDGCGAKGCAHPQPSSSSESSHDPACGSRSTRAMKVVPAREPSAQRACGSTEQRTPTGAVTCTCVNALCATAAAAAGGTSSSSTGCSGHACGSRPSSPRSALPSPPSPPHSRWTSANAPSSARRPQPAGSFFTACSSAPLMNTKQISPSRWTPGRKGWSS